jgi:hypothetical protein
MKCYANRISVKLMNILSTATVAVTTAGTGYRILPGQSDDQSDASQEFKFVTSLTFAGGASTPTAQLVIQGSADGVAWVDLVSGASRTTEGTFNELLDSTSVGLLPWVRARLVLGGGTAPSVYASVEVVSTGSFQLSTS